MQYSKVARFLIDYSIHEDLISTIDLVEQHWYYGTIIVTQDEEGVTGVVRWNTENNIAHILEAVVRPDQRNGGILKQCIVYGLKLNPHITGLTWDRKRKYPSRNRASYKIKEIGL